MAKTESLTVDLPSNLVAGLRESVRSGAYASESAAIEELLQTWFGLEGTEQPSIEVLRAFVTEGIADAEGGRVSDAEEVYARVKARIKAISATDVK